MAGYNNFINSKGGKNFASLFGKGGKFGKINVLFDIETKKKINHTEAKENDRVLSSGEKTKVSAGFNLRIALTANSTSKNIDAISAVKIGATLLHESQHAEIMTKNVLSGQGIDHSFYQHQKMKDTNGEYYKARVSYLLVENRDVFINLYIKTSRDVERDYGIKFNLKRVTDDLINLPNYFDDY
jgi:hypothetical protein